MIIDKILDRKDGVPYAPKRFYNDVMDYGEIGYDITEALDSGEEQDVKRALCEYIETNGYNATICEYIMSVEWLK